MDGPLALDLWDVVKEVLRSTNNTARHGRLAQGDLWETGDHSISKNNTKTPTGKRKREVEQLSNVGYVPTNTHSSQGESQLYIFEDNEAVIKMIFKGRISNSETRVSEPTELRLIGCSTESTWTQRSKTNMLIQKPDSLTI